MSAPAKCPGCGTKLQPDWESCPNCPMSFLDEAPQKSAFQNDNFRSFGLPILFFGGLAFFVWTVGQYLWRTAEEGSKTVSAGVKTDAHPSPEFKGASAAPPAAGGYVPSADAPSFDGPKAAEEPEGPGTISVMPEESRKAKPVTEWKFRGVIYDLISLKPVPSVQIVFTDNETNSRAQIQTDAQGRYRAILPALPGRGYLVTMKKTGYEKSYLDPATSGVPEMELARRREIAKELSSLIAEPASLEHDSDRPLVTDFYLAPK